MINIAHDIGAMIALAAGLAALGFYAATMAIAANYARQDRKSNAWFVAFAFTFIALATLIVSQIGRAIDWIVGC